MPPSTSKSQHPYTTECAGNANAAHGLGSPSVGSVAPAGLAGCDDEINDRLREANCDWAVSDEGAYLRVYDADGEYITRVPRATTWQELVIAERFFGIGFRRGEGVGREALAAHLRVLLGCAKREVGHD